MAHRIVVNCLNAKVYEPHSSVPRPFDVVAWTEYALILKDASEYRRYVVREYLNAGEVRATLTDIENSN